MLFFDSDHVSGSSSPPEIILHLEDFCLIQRVAQQGSISSLLTSMSENEQTQNFFRCCCVMQLSGTLRIHIQIVPLSQRSKHVCQKLLNQFSLLLLQKVSLKHTQMSVFTHNH